MTDDIFVRIKTQSEYLKLHWKDLLKSFLIAFLTTLFAGASLLVQKADLPTWLDIKILLTSAISAAVAYLFKNFFSNSDGQFLKKENSTTPVATIQDGTAIKE